MICFLSKQRAAKHQGKRGARTIPPPPSAPLIVPSKTSVPYKTSEI